ncbi:hypothetical protein PoB_007642400 [Plakobranchus ocellatus]|uniref:Uncharacterized protein n=1 Tax=Plakobranchus ocellatus TaxID=259542 RepID=A0AAV4E0V9_9GAST|nr:hypothetical protein PoB_007642400 [Plakobranchus ocellatus]
MAENVCNARRGEIIVTLPSDVIEPISSNTSKLRLPRPLLNEISRQGLHRLSSCLGIIRLRKEDLEDGKLFKPRTLWSAFDPVAGVSSPTTLRIF